MIRLSCYVQAADNIGYGTSGDPDRTVQFKFRTPPTVHYPKENPHHGRFSQRALRAKYNLDEYEKFCVNS